MKMKTILLIVGLCSVLSLTGQEAGQTKEIRGRVLNSQNRQPVAGAVISAASLPEAKTTDAAGAFTVTLRASDHTLLVQYAGFYPVEYTLRDEQEVVIYLLPLSLSGYGAGVKVPFAVRRMADHTGTSRPLFARDQKGAVHFSDELFAGTVHGVRSLQKSGMPGEGNAVNYRGIRTLYGNNTPVFMVDGMPILPNTRPSVVFTGYSRNMFDFMSVRELEQLVFSSGFDAAPLGAIGPHGVVVMSTDRATDMDTRVEFETTNGLSFLPREIPVLNAGEFRDYLTQIGQSVLNSDAMKSNFPFLYGDATLGEKYWGYQHNTNWQKEVFSPAFSTENVLKVKGGDNIAKYTILAGYVQQNGIEENSSLNRYFARFNGDMVMHKRVDMFTNVGFSHYDNSIQEQGMVHEHNPVFSALLNPSILAPKRTSNTGRPIDVWDSYKSQFNVSNPAFLVKNIKSSNYIYSIMVNLGMKYKFTPNFNLNALFGINYDYNREKLFVPGRSSNTVVPIFLPDGFNAYNTVRVGVTEGMAYYGNVTVDYTTTWNRDHRLDLQAGVQMLFKNEAFEVGVGYNTPTDYNQSLSNVTNAYAKFLDGYDDQWHWGNAFLRAFYDYREQFYLGVAATVETNSICGENASLFQLYPAVNVGWKMHRAGFMQDADWVGDLTLRGEWSRTGNALMPMKLGGFYYENAFYKELGGIVRGNIPNNDLTPEIVNTFNLGVDFSTLGRKLTLAFDFYHSTTTDLVLPENLSSAFGSKARYGNTGKLQNLGAGLSLQALLLTRGDFQWHAGATVSFDRSEVKSLGGYEQIITTLDDGAEVMTRKGESPYQFYGYRTAGVYTTTAEAEATGLTDHRRRTFQGGDMRFVNVCASDQVIDDKDKTLIGDPTPDFYGGFSTEFRYKAFSLQAQFTYSYGNDVYNALRSELESMRDFKSQTRAVKSRWTYEGQQTSMPRADLEGLSDNDRFSDRWIEDGSFLKLKKLTFNYEHPGSWWIFKSFQAYLSADNLFVITKYLGYDPEFSWSYQPQYQGVDYAKVPPARTVKLGIRVGL